MTSYYNIIKKCKDVQMGKLIQEILKLNKDLRFNDLAKALIKWDILNINLRTAAVITHSERKVVCLLQFQSIHH